MGIGAGFAALSLAFVHLFAGKLRFLDGLPRSRWLSLAGGVSVAYVFVHVLPDLSEGQETVEESFGLLVSIDAAALAVLFAFLAGGIVLNVLKEELPDEHESRFWPFALGLSAYAVLLLSL
jgi:hypothetical protein